MTPLLTPQLDKASLFSARATPCAAFHSVIGISVSPSESLGHREQETLLRWFPLSPLLDPVTTTSQGHLPRSTNAEGSAGRVTTSRQMFEQIKEKKGD